MRIHKEQESLTVHAIAGTHVVHLGFDVTQRRRKGLLGFAIRRTNHGDGESRWIRNKRCFAGLARDATTWPSSEAPVQKMRWADYTPKPGQKYRYEVFAASGEPGRLRLGPSVTIDIFTETPDRIVHPKDETVHQVYFNRGGAASQAYVEHFGDKDPEEVGDSAFQWLSRGLLEGLIGFIRQAEKGDELLLCVYEFQLPEILDELRDAQNRGVKLRVLYDAGTGESSPRKKNEEAVADAHLIRSCRPRAGLEKKISHHKFMVLIRDDKPRAVWTGSTNFTRNGLYAQLNVGHAVVDSTIARAFAALHEKLWNDPDRDETRSVVEQLGPVVTAQARTHHYIFSPRSREEAMQLYLNLLKGTPELCVMTNPFGVDKRIEAAFTQLGGKVTKLGMLGSTSKKGGQVRRLDGIDGTDYTQPARMPTALDQWQEEQFHGFSHAYIHTKFLLIDPLGDAPVLVTGSANFSKPSCVYNDENMLVIRGHTGLADVYLTEFLRLFEHYGYRYFAEVLHLGAPPPLADSDNWTNRYFRPNSRKERDRLLFSGHA